MTCARACLQMAAVSVLLVVVFLWFISVPACAGTLADYDRQLESFSRELSTALEMERRDPGSSRQALSAFSRQVPESIHVSVGGKPTRYDLKWISQGLYDIRRTPAKERAQRIERLIVESRTHQAAIHSVPRHDPESQLHARSILARVLKRSEFKPSRLDNLTRRVLEALFNALSKLDVPKGTAETIGWILAAIAAVVFIVLLVLLTMSLIRHFSSCPPTAKASPRQSVERKTRVSPESLLAQAEQDASEGSYREAFRRVYLATLLVLDRSKLVTYADSRTNWEYTRALRLQGADGPSEAFQPMTLLFDEMIYGKRPVTQEDYLFCLRQFRQLEAML